MTPGEQITLMKIIETREACQNPDPTPKDLKVIDLQCGLINTPYIINVCVVIKLICRLKCFLQHAVQLKLQPDLNDLLLMLAYILKDSFHIQLTFSAPI